MLSDVNVKTALADLYKLDSAICTMQAGLARTKLAATSRQEVTLTEEMLKMQAVTLSHVRNAIFALEGK